jgi:hypothetical protein
MSMILSAIFLTSESLDGISTTGSCDGMGHNDTPKVVELWRAEDGRHELCAAKDCVSALPSGCRF